MDSSNAALTVVLDLLKGRVKLSPGWCVCGGSNASVSRQRCWSGTHTLCPPQLCPVAVRYRVRGTTPLHWESDL